MAKKFTIGTVGNALPCLHFLATSAAGKPMVTPLGNGKPPRAVVTAPFTSTSMVALGSYEVTVTETAH